MSYSRQDLYAFGEPFGTSATKHLAGSKLRTYGGGGGDPGPTQTTVQNSNLPEYVQPYVESMLGAAQNQVYNFNPNGTVGGFKPYTPYSSDMNDYQAGFSPMQQQSFQGAQNLQTPGQYNQASQMLGMAGLGSLQTAGQLSQAGQNYSALPSSYLSAQAPQLQDYSMQGPGDVQGARTQAEGFGQPSDVRAQNVSSQNVSSQNVNAPTMQGAETSYNPNLNQYQMGPASQVRTQSFNQPGTAQSYMNPYLSASLSPQLDEIRRQYGVSQTNQMSNATKQGAFGGSREALMAAENQRNMNTGMNQAITQGYNTAFNNAQQQFNTQQQANLTAQQANQQAGLTTGQQNLAAKLGVQQLGTQTGLQTQLANLSNRQQAAVNNQALQFQANGMNSQQALQAALANQQSGLQAQQLNQSAGLQAGLANQQTAYNSALQNAQMRQQANLANQQTAQQANLANQQMGYNVGNTNLQSRLGVQQLGAGQNLQAQLANQGAYGQAQQLAANQQQFGANLGLQGLQGALSGYNQVGQAGGALSQVGQQQFGAQKDIIGLQNQMGTQQQAAEQAKINQAIQNYATAQQYPMMQLGNISNLLRGLPMQSTTTQSYQAQPSGINTLAGLGTGIAGAAQLLKAEGGTVKSYAGGGITSLANRQSIAEDLNPQQLAQVIKNRTIPPTIGKAIQEDNLREAQAARMAGIDEAPTNLPTQTMAEGGIVSFSTGDVVQGIKMPAYGLKPTDLEKTDTTGLQDILANYLNPKTNKPYTEEEIADKRRAKEAQMGIKNLFPEREKEFEKTKADIEDSKSTAKGLALLQASGKILENANKPGLMGIGAGISGFNEAYAPALKDIRAQEAGLRKEKFLAQDAQNAMLQAQMSGDDKMFADAQNAYATHKSAIINAENQNVAARNAVRGDEAKYKAELGGKIIAGVLDNMGKTDAASITSGSANKGHVASLLGSLTTDVNSARNSHNSNFKRDVYDEATTFIRENKGKKLAPEAKRTYDKYVAYVTDYKASEDNIKLIGQRYEPLLRQSAKAAKFSDEVIERLVAEAYNPNLNKPKEQTTNKSGAKASDFDS